MTQSRAWILFFVFFCPFVLAIPVVLSPVTIDAGHYALITAYSPSPATPQSSPTAYTTRFTQRPSEGLAPAVRINRLLLTSRRRIEFYCRWVVGSVIPEVRPKKENFLYLRSLEDPVFMAASELRSIPQNSASPTDTHHSRTLTPVDALDIRDILHSLESELEKRSMKDRQRIANDVNEIVHRMPSTNDTSL